MRIGTTGTARVIVENQGDGNLATGGPDPISNLSGTVAAGSGKFSGTGGSISLPDAQTQTFTYTYTPTGHALDSTGLQIQFANGNADGTNMAQTVNVTLTGRGVGPTYQSTAASGSTIDFGGILVGETATETLQASNATTDDVGDPTSPLTRLTLNSYTITGSGASNFTLDGFTPEMTLDAGESTDLDVHFTPLSQDAYTALLRVFTDEEAALGGNGVFFEYALQGFAVIPEPGALMLLLSGVAGLLVRRRGRAAR